MGSDDDILKKLIALGEAEKQSIEKRATDEDYE